MLLNNLPPAAAPSPQGALVTDATVDNFMPAVVEASLQQPVVLVFWSPASPAAKQVTAALEKLVQAQGGALRMAKVNIDTNPEIAQQFRVQAIPTVYAMFQGQPVDGFRGPQQEPQLKQWIERILKATGAAAGGPAADIDAALKQAEQALASGEWEAAQDIFTDVLGMDPNNAAAYAGVIRAMLAGGHRDHARTMLDDAPDAIVKDKALAAARTAVELAEQAAQAGPAQELAAKVEANPADHQMRYDLALALLAAGQREEAVDHLLEIVRRQRGWNEEAARKQLVKLFEAFGPADPLTVSGRKRLSSILFA